MAIAKAFFLGIVVMAAVTWLVPALLGAVFFGFALVGAVAIVRKLISIGLPDYDASKDGEP